MEQQKSLYIKDINLWWGIKLARNKVWSGDNRTIVEKDMRFGFETMCIIQDTILSLVCF